MRKTCDSVDSILWDLEGAKWNKLVHQDAYHDPVEILKVELRFLRTFLKYMLNWRDSDEMIWADFLVLDTEFEAALSDVKRDLSTASDDQEGYETSAELLDRVISRLQEKITFFRTKVMEIYERVCNYPSQSKHPNLTESCHYFEFFDSLEQNLKDILHGKYKLVEPVVVKALMVLEENIPFKDFAWWSIHGTLYEEYYALNCFGEFGIQVASLSYLYWVEKMDDEKKSLITEGSVMMLNDLQQKLKANIPQVGDIYLNVFRYIRSPTCRAKEKLVNYFVDLLVPKKDQKLEILHVRTRELMMLLLLYPSDRLYNEDDEVQLLLSDVIAVANEIVSLSNLTPGDVDEMIENALFKLYSKMDLLKVEAFVTVVLNTEDAGVLCKYSIDAYREGLRLLRKLLTDSRLGKTETSKAIWTHIAAVTEKVCPVSTKKISSSIELLNVFKMLRILMTEAFLMELKNRHTHSDVVINFGEDIDTIYEGLALIRTFLMGPGEKDGKLFYALESVSEYVRSLYDSLLASKFREDLIQNISLLLPELVIRINPLKTEIKNIYLQERSSRGYNFPRTNGLGFVDFLLGNLGELYKAKDLELLKYGNDESNACMRNYVEVLYREIKIMRTSLKKIVGQYAEHSDLKDLGSRIIEVSYEAEYFINTILVNGHVVWYHALWFSDLIEEVKLIELQASEIFDKMCSFQVDNVAHTSSFVISPIALNMEEIVIDLDDQAELIMDQLTRGSLQRDVVSIIGMAGLGKTTLAKRVYNNSSITCYFHIRGWCNISQVYRKRELLLDILGDTMELTDDILQLDEEALELKLYKCVKNRRYLIVLDDLWSIDAWNDLEFSLPDDKNGSRILITSRLADVASKTNPNSLAHPLRLFSDGESWNLLQKKLFDAKDCPVELVEVGKQIARSCKGLPLAVVAISGLLGRASKNQDLWEEVAKTLTSQIADDPETRCRDILDLSYTHLPNHLKPCFLYLGAFLKDKEIPVSKLTWLWIAEGFVQNTELESLEQLAEKYLNDLISRSLVMASKRKSNGRVKTCRIHDMLRALCLVRCEEENFLHLVTGYDELFASSYEDLDYGFDPSYFNPASSITCAKHRLSICSKRKHFAMSMPSGPRVRSLLFFAENDMYPRCPYNVGFIIDNFKLLTVLDLECINMGHSFPRGIKYLIHLRYLSVCGDFDSIPASMSCLWNLETLLVKGLKGKVDLPYTIWSMAKLRHVHASNFTALSFPGGDSSQLVNLVTFSTPVLFSGEETEKMMRQLTKLQKLRCIFADSRVDIVKGYVFPVLDFLTELESLKVIYSGRFCHPCEFDFPLNLKQLTLSNFCLPWDCISEIARLPNLEVLKLLSRAFEGKRWDMREGEFLKLKFLKLDGLNIAQWNASGDHLPNLERLVLQNCRHLEEVPSGFVDIPTLVMIEMQLCRSSAEVSVRSLKEEQLALGIDDLKVFINF